MRISVCEYLRLMTSANWCYIKPGHWACFDGQLEAFRVEDGHCKDGHFEIRRKGRCIKRLVYFKGLHSNEVRADLRRRKRR